MNFLCDEDGAGFLQWFRFYAECSSPRLFGVCTFDPSESRTSHFNCVSASAQACAQAPPFYGMSFAAENSMSIRQIFADQPLRFLSSDLAI